MMILSDSGWRIKDSRDERRSVTTYIRSFQVLDISLEEINSLKTKLEQTSPGMTGIWYETEGSLITFYTTAWGGD